jgi:hypothetical protein
MPCLEFCFISFLIFFCGKSVISHGQKNRGPHVWANLGSATIGFANFDLWMFYNGVDTFDLAINFLNDTQVPMHVNVGLFEMNETIRQYMVVQLQVLLDRFGLLHQVIAFVKDESTNLYTMATTMTMNPLRFLGFMKGHDLGM